MYESLKDEAHHLYWPHKIITQLQTEWDIGKLEHCV